MSSLAGALIPPENSLLSQAQSGYDYTTSNNDHIQPNSEDEQEEQPHDEEMNDLFGNEADGDVDEARQDDDTRENSDAVSEDAEAEAEQRRALEYGEDEEPADVAIEVKEADVSFPNLPMPTSSNGESWVIRMPNFVKLDSKPFHPDTYIGPEQEDEDTQHAETLREKSMTIKLKVENTLRWRWIKDQSGNDKRQSNSRIIRWSDGTLSLRLGKELFDITQSVDTAGGVPRNINPSASQSQSQSQNALQKAQGLTYLVAQHKRSQVLQAEAVITGHMTLRPTGMQSETHRMLVRAVGQKHNKVARLRMAPDPQVDPEREKMELMKQDAKKSKRRSNVDSGPARRRRPSFRRAEQEWTDDDEDIFRQSDEDDEGRASGVSKAKRKRDEEKSGYQEDDFLVADDSDEDADFGASRKRREEEEEDPLDKLDAKIQRAARGKHADSDEDAEGEDVGMDVESEEEEDQRVRKAGSAGSRRRQQPLYDDDEDE
ncbi:rna polymerase-associated protein leo1 [Moniliophthora roreri MCA 2997]|uniref:Rna polymerase-associated protein leo1 n=2 Tax=Moniliophthora roreri TaxID=221103 RepID=V2XXW1_MONRO|nr:rna polymerase-associated protein leo1 [Moniliophthora roreri MCA 2997]KAI3600351.1 rna polymerase-associated protein leo1 [Moniliophthora roreri]